MTGIGQRKFMKATKLKNFAVICIAAGKSQLPVIAKAKSLGYTIVAIDQNKEAPGFKHADYKIYQSTYDADLIIEELDKLDKKIEWAGVINRSSGPPVISAAKICKYFHLPGVPVESAESLVNKDQMRTACSKRNIPIPNYKIYEIDECNSESIDLLPFVVKPALSLIGKSGVSVVRTKDKIAPSIKYASENTINNKILFEEFLQGPDISLVSFVNDGQLFPICLVEEINIEKKDGTLAAKGYKTLHSDLNDWTQQAHDIARNIISEFNIKRSAFMISLRSDSNKNLRLIEVHLDIGGDLMIEAFYPKAFNFDFLKFAVEMAVGINKSPIDLKVKPTAIYYNEGDGLLSDRGYKVFTAKTMQILEDKILKASLQN